MLDYNQRAMTERQLSMRERSVGLCYYCAYQRRVESAKGSVFYLCTLSERDPRFAKYPRLPVLQCSGYTPSADSAHE